MKLQNRFKNYYKKSYIISMVLIFIFSLILSNKTLANKNFLDVKSNTWYYDAISYVSENNIMIGMDEKNFEPKSPITRSMIINAFYNMAGKPEVENNYSFKDVDSNKWYAESILWAKGESVINGYPDGTFKPDNLITIEELASIILNYDKKNGIYSEEFLNYDDNKKFNDENQISKWAREAIAYCKYNGILIGDTNNFVSPKKNAIRAEAATIFMRYDQNNKKKNDDKKEDEIEQDEEENKDKENEKKKEDKKEDKKSSSSGGSSSGGGSSSSGGGSSTGSGSMPKGEAIVPTSVSLDKTNITMEVGDEVTLTATVLPSDATNKTVTYTVNNSNVTVTSDGKITGEKVGTSIVTATTSNGKTAKVNVTVNEKVDDDIVPVNSVSVEETQISLAVKEKKTINVSITPSNATNKTLTYETNSECVTVSTSGEITAVSPGTSKITVSSNNGCTAQVTVRVKYDSKTLNIITNAMTKSKTLNASTDLIYMPISYADYYDKMTSKTSSEINDAKNIWDLQTMGDKVFIGTGNYSGNMGPVPLFYYYNNITSDAPNGTIRLSAKYQCEEIGRFVFTGGELFFPDIDPRTWGAGNFYRFNGVSKFSGSYNSTNPEKSGFEVPESIHDWDIVKFKDKYFLGVSSLNPEITTLVVTTTDGINYEKVHFYRAGEEIETKFNYPISDSPTDILYSYFRAYDLWEFNGKLYAYVDSNATGTYTNPETGQSIRADVMGIYIYDEEQNAFICDEDLYINSYASLRLKDDAKMFLGSRSKESDGGEDFTIVRKLIYKDNFVYVSYGKLKRTPDMYNIIDIFGSNDVTDTCVRDINVIGDNLYVLTNTKKSDNNYVNRIYQTTDLTNFKLLYEVSLPTFFRSFEYIGDKLIFGTGSPYKKENYVIKTYEGGGDIYIYKFDN